MTTKAQVLQKLKEKMLAYITSNFYDYPVIVEEIRVTLTKVSDEMLYYQIRSLGEKSLTSDDLWNSLVERFKAIGVQIDDIDTARKEGLKKYYDTLYKICVSI
jgi:hypothetical protein